MKSASPEPLNLLDFSLDQLTGFIQGSNLPSYRADQIWEWMYCHYATSCSQMSNLPLSLRNVLDEETTLQTGQVVGREESRDGQTIKVLFQLVDNTLIETVLMRYEKRRTLCISTQAGCAIGCVFCATGQMGFFRNLSVGEITNQALYFARLLAEGAERVTNIVMMGMGEPLHNYANTLQAIDNLTNPKGFKLGARKITISTVGLVPAIRRYADEMRQSPLAVSLHAATDLERDRLIPINRRWPLSELMDACHYYINKTGRRITFEWALIAGENDTVDQATALGKLIRNMLCHVNLIPLNPTAGYGGQPSSRKRVAAFQKELMNYGISSTVRVRRGIDIKAGCGQLRDRLLSDVANTPEETASKQP